MSQNPLSISSVSSNVSDTANEDEATSDQPTTASSQVAARRPSDPGEPTTDTAECDEINQDCAEEPLSTVGGRLRPTSNRSSPADAGEFLALCLDYYQIRIPVFIVYWCPRKCGPDEHCGFI